MPTMKSFDFAVKLCFVDVIVSGFNKELLKL